MDRDTLEHGFRTFEYDWSTRNNTAPPGVKIRCPVLKGTNRRVRREYRVGKLEHDTPTIGNKAKLILLVRMYSLGGTAWSDDESSPKVWGVSYYKPEGLPRPSRKLRDMLGKDAVPTPLDTYHAPWRCPEGYQEYKHQFWTEREALQYYDRVVNPWRLHE